MRDVIYHDRPRLSTGQKARRILIAFVIAAAAVILIAVIFIRSDLDMNRQAIESLRQSVTEACVQCYAIEGTYPVDINYLEQYYGVHYDGSKYEVSLDAGSDNDLPAVQITLRT